MKPDPAAARARAAILREEAQALAEPARGMLLARAEFLEKFADEVERLTAGNRPVMVKPVTSSELARRGESVARTSAQKSQHPVRLAIAASEWRTLTKYASQRLRKTQAALSRYILGSLDTPPEVADRVRKDFGLGDDVWPRPPRR